MPFEPAAGTQDAVQMLFVHAHPDDETINNGATMARYAAQGARITLITCTRGEQGEVIPAHLAHLAAGGRGPAGEQDAFGDRLGDHRVDELATAMAALGVVDHRFLGDPHTPGRTAGEVLAGGGSVYRDSGMAYDAGGVVVPSPQPPAKAFALADAEHAAELLAGLLAQLRPRVVVTYGPDGGYGHPDHVRAHQVTMRAIDLLTTTARVAPKVYWTVNPDQLDSATAVIDARDFTAAKIAALAAHETQVKVAPDGATFALSNDVPQILTGIEGYRLVRGEMAGPFDERGREIDLLSGTAA
jgi:N-acetyl-1-D-myo-inositol-2-amino-2-deoxy-alpha-D-glucopyranoside deacetylase